MSNKKFFSNGSSFEDLKEFASICHSRDANGLPCKNCKYFGDECKSNFVVINDELSRSQSKFIFDIMMGIQEY